VGGPGGTSGFFERGYDPETRTVELTYAFREDLPPWIDTGGVALVAGKGVPTVTYVTLRAMKTFGVGLGEARAFRLCSIHEVESIAHLDWLVGKHPTSSLDELVKSTHSFVYTETAIIQSGHRVVAVRADIERAERRPINDLLVHYEQMAADPSARRAEHDRVLSKYARRRTDQMLIGYDVVIEVEPWRK